METGDLLTPGAADASVRPAQVSDVRAMAAVQVRSWRRSYAGLLPDHLLDSLSGEQMATGWQAAVIEPPSARHAVLVACAGPAVVGLAALAPSGDVDAGDGDAELVALEVDPMHQRVGHGSRLLAAVVDTARERAFSTLRVWVPAGDAARRDFLTSAGLRPDGARRRLRPDGPDSPTGEPAGPDATEVVEERMAAALP